ncbi:sulfite exporter TauE/SafE family protein [Filobacillus milosensis]|uniref:Probable membrane transporter protein n=1 Tax=Filobacillus milosensis TaxID=94137 RepID=A0A4Y8IPX1_9BACI|nr:sulfite exporter TauE/SafE family protein [Filobacillus milosensis]TFB21831.1 sulfite exporter TauE/SafE family protein [Filobacillus milosensis]
MELITLFLIGTVATTLGTLAGGGGLISLPAMLALGMPVHSAIGANKVSNTISSLSSFLVVYRQKGVTMKEGLKVIPVSLAGGVTGGLIAASISADLMYKVAIGLLVFAFVFSFIGKADFSGHDSFKLSKKGTPLLYGIGIYDGVFGPGQGTLMLYLFSYLNIAYYRAVGLVRVATFSSCFGAAISYISTGKIIWPLTIALLLGSVTGAQAGVRLAGKLKPKHVKPLLRVVTVALIIHIIIDNL